jgi:integrase
MSAWLIEMPKVVADAYKLEHIYADNNKAMPSREDFQAMLAPNAKYGNLRSRTLLVLLLSSGIRIGEALNLKWGDIDLEAEPLTIKLRAEITKFNRERWTFATPECRDFLVKLREWYKSEGAPCGEDDYIFVTHNSKKEWGPVVYASQYKALRELFKNVKNEKGKSRYKFFPHLLRAVFKSWAMEGGMSEDLANKLCGHRTYMQEYDLRNGVEEYKRAVPKLTIFPTPEDEFEKLAREMTNMSKEQFEALIMKVTKLRSEAGMRLICPSDGAELRRQIVITLIKRSLSRGDSVVDKLVDEAMQKEIQPERLEELERAEQSAARVLKHLNNRTM